MTVGISAAQAMAHLIKSHPALTIQGVAGGDGPIEGIVLNARRSSGGIRCRQPISGGVVAITGAITKRIGNTLCPIQVIVAVGCHPAQGIGAGFLAAHLVVGVGGDQVFVGLGCVVRAVFVVDDGALNAVEIVVFGAGVPEPIERVSMVAT